MNDNTHVIGQLQGFLLQVRHMLFELISVDDRMVSLELLDDVSVQVDKTVVAEQLKSVTSSTNPTTDYSENMWKTFFNWLTYVSNGSLSLENTQFRMVVVSNHNLKLGSIIDQFHNSSTINEAHEALCAARLKLWGKNDANRLKIPNTYSNYLEQLFSPENKDIVERILLNFKVSIHNDDYDEKLLERFCSQPIPEEFAENLLIFMLGWVDNEVNKYAKNGKPAIIKSKDYRNALTAQLRMYNQRQSIPRLSPEITRESACVEVEKQDTYIRQLDLINQDYETKLIAASDYLQTKAETIFRSDKGVLTQLELNDYQEKIFRIWSSKRRQITLSPNVSDVEKGQSLYYQMSESVVLVSEAFPSFFGGGTLHTMANEPAKEPQIGWHPQYKTFLNGGKSNE